MSVAELKKYILKSKYARHNKQMKRRETYDEAVNRVREMMLGQYPVAADVINWAYDEVLQETALGSQRAMQFGGMPMLQHCSRGYNCCCSYADRLRFFQETFYLLLCGCGVGFSVQKHHVIHLPDFAGERVYRARHPFTLVDAAKSSTFVVPDTIEGWADALGVLISSYFPGGPFPEYHGHHILFDFSQIRPQGSYLSSGAGKAPGPGPLRRALHKIEGLIDRCIRDGQTRLRPIDVYDIVMHASDAVLAGGVRRSATICVFSPDDEEMATAKCGNWFLENPQRARSNNSALLVRGQTTYEEFDGLMQHVREFGEPGFLWADSKELLVNPCLSPDTLLATQHGLIRMGDLADRGVALAVVSDNRIGKGDDFSADSYGVSLHGATPVVVTQRNAPIFSVETDHGHLLKVTATHEFPTQRGRLKLCDMRVGDTIYLPSGEANFGDVGTFEDGLVLGLITGDGTFGDNTAFVDVWESDFDQLDYILNATNKVIDGLQSISRGGRTWPGYKWSDQTPTHGNRVGKRRTGGRRLYRHLKERLGIAEPRSIKDRVPECVFRGTRQMVVGYIMGLFFADGCPQMAGHDSSATISYRLGQANLDLLRDVQILLGQFAIVSKIYSRRKAGLTLLPDGRGGKRYYECKEFYDLIINRPNTIRLLGVIGLLGRKKAALEAMLDVRGHECRKPEKYITMIKRIEPAGRSDVYCLTQHDTNAIVAGGCVTGQCCEIGMYPRVHLSDESQHLLNWYNGPIGYDSDAMMVDRSHKVVSGFSYCNLSSINGSKVRTTDDFYRACRVAAILGTLQAGFTDFPYLGPITEEIVRREALLGVSITSVMSNPTVMLRPETLRRGAQIVLETNEWLSRIIGINPAARATCLKPEGTGTLMLGSLACGAHGWPFRRGIKHVQANVNEAVYQWFRLHNPQACEPSVYCQNGTTDVISFPIEAPPGVLLESDFSAVEFLDAVKNIYLNWVVPGKRPERCTQPWLHHSVSNTVKVRPGEWPDVTRFIYDNRESFAGISLLPHTGDKDYDQAPNVAVYDYDEMRAAYGEQAVLRATRLWRECLDVFDNDVYGACEAVLGRPRGELNGRQQVWVSAVRVLAEEFGLDDKRATYLIKDVHNWETYAALKETFTPVDYEALIEDHDDTSMTAESACSGGACLI
jgi:intein/homing endonuclease